MKKPTADTTSPTNRRALELLSEAVFEEQVPNFTEANRYAKQTAAAEGRLDVTNIPFATMRDLFNIAARPHAFRT